METAFLFGIVVGLFVGLWLAKLMVKVAVKEMLNDLDERIRRDGIVRKPTASVNGHDLHCFKDD